MKKKGLAKESLHGSRRGKKKGGRFLQGFYALLQRKARRLCLTKRREGKKGSANVIIASLGKEGKGRGKKKRVRTHHGLLWGKKKERKIDDIKKGRRLALRRRKRGRRKEGRPDC